MSKAELIEQLKRYRRREELFIATDSAAHIGNYEWDYVNNCLSDCSNSFAEILGMNVVEAIESLSSWEKMIDLVHIVERITRNLIEQILQRIQIHQHEVSVSASIGIALYPEDGTTSEELIRQADRAMYTVKDTGKNNFALAQLQTLN